MLALNRHNLITEGEKLGWSVVYEKAIRDDGSLFFPERLTQEFLDKAKRTMGSYIFANQYQNEIIPEGDQTFKKEWFRYYTALPEPINTFCFIDPAISTADTADYIGIVLVSVDIQGQWYVRWVRRLRCNPTRLIELCFEIDTNFKPAIIGIEDTAFQRSIVHFAQEEMRRRGRHIPVTGVKQAQDKTKEMRILSLVPRFEWGSLFLNQGLQDLELELLQFPRGSHDDLCFVAGTLIATDRGSIPIEAVRPGMKVFTPFGWDFITHTSHSIAPVIEKLGLTGTPKHKVFTWHGLVQMDRLTSVSQLSLMACAELIRWQCLSTLVSMTFDLKEWVGREITTYLPTERTLRDALKQKACTLPFMSFILAAKYRLAFMFIILTAIRSIMIFRTLSVYRLRNILNFLKNSLRNVYAIWTGFALLLKIGMLARREEPHTEKSLSMLGKKKNGCALIASNAGKELSPSFQPEPNIAGIDAARNGKEERKNECLVYNLRTKRHRLYYANGILVSNCDALSSIQQIAHTPVQVRKEHVPKSPNDPGYESWFIKQLHKRGASE